jgi:hypothetical protein
LAKQKPVEVLIGQLLEAIRPALESRVPTLALIEELVNDSGLENLRKEILGREGLQVGAAKCPDDEKSNALLTALSAGLELPVKDAVAATLSRLRTELSALVSAMESKWLACISLGDISYGTTPVFDFDSFEVPCAILPAVADVVRASALKEIAQRFGITPPSAIDALPVGSFFVTVSGGSQTHVASEAIVRLSAVRDAARYAGLVSASVPILRHHARPDVDTIRRHEIVLFPVTGGTVVTEPVWAADVYLEVDLSLSKDPRWRAGYDRALRVLVKHAPGVKDKSTVGPRLSRSLRIISRACGQSNADIQFLLCLVALETLASIKKEEIAGAVADIGARILGVDASERKSVYRELKQAYDARSRLVHEGEPPSLGMEPKVLEGLQNLVLRVWAKTSGLFFGLVDNGISEDQLAAGFDEFRGIALLKYGTPWEEAFGLAGADNGGVE